jgi:hypothetical protein
MARPWAGEPPGSGTGAMLATRCRDRCPATGADGVTAAATVATIGVILAGSNTVTMAAALTAAIASSVPPGSCPASSAATTSTATTTSTAAALSQRRTYSQGNDSESEHEHTEDCHVACLPGSLIASRGSRVHLLTAPQSRAQLPGEHAPCPCVSLCKGA